MAEISGPFGLAGWGEDEWYKVAPLWASSGVTGTGLALSFSGLTGTVQPGVAWVAGSGYENTTPLTVVVPANTHSTNSLRGRLVLRRDRGAAQTAIVYRAGVPAASPTPPALTQNAAGGWEVALWSFTVPPNSGTSITAITDERVSTDPGGEGRGTLGYVERTTTLAAATIQLADPLLVVTAVMPSDLGSRRIGLEFNGELLSAVGPAGYLSIYRDGSEYRTRSSATLGGQQAIPMHISAEVVEAQGSVHTYQVRVGPAASGASNGIFATVVRAASLRVSDQGRA